MRRIYSSIERVFKCQTFQAESHPFLFYHWSCWLVDVLLQSRGLVAKLVCGGQWKKRISRPKQFTAYPCLFSTVQFTAWPLAHWPPNMYFLLLLRTFKYYQVLHRQSSAWSLYLWSPAHCFETKVCYKTISSLRICVSEHTHACSTTWICVS